MKRFALSCLLAALFAADAAAEHHGRYTEFLYSNRHASGAVFASESPYRRANLYAHDTVADLDAIKAMPEVQPLVKHRHGYYGHGAGCCGDAWQGYMPKCAYGHFGHHQKFGHHGCCKGPRPTWKPGSGPCGCCSPKCGCLPHFRLPKLRLPKFHLPKFHVPKCHAPKGCGGKCHAQKHVVPAQKGFIQKHHAQKGFIQKGHAQKGCGPKCGKGHCGMGLLERLKSKFRFPSLHHHGCHTCGPKCGGETHVYKGGVEHYDGKVIIEEDGAPSTPERVQPPATEDLPPQPDTPEAAEEENPYLKAAEKIQLPLLRVIK